MKKLFLHAALALATCAAVAPLAGAQTATHQRFDNFDFERGVRVATVPIAAVNPPPKTTNSKVRLAAMHQTAAQRLAATTRPTLYVGLSQPANGGNNAHALAMSISKSLDGFTTGNTQVDGLIAAAGVRNGVDPVLLYAVMHRESSFKPRALSPKGASGLMQLMPGTAARFGVRNIFDPAQNIEGGARYIRFLLDYFKGDVALALAGYNAGEGAVDRYGRRVPPYRETQEYVRRISERYALMRDPQAALRAATYTTQQAVAIARETPEAALYERNIYAVRLPDGKLRLVSQ